MAPLLAAAVRAPCSTSNLGAGFDCIGLALDRHLELSFEPGGSDLTVVREGTLAELEPSDEGDLALQSFLRTSGKPAAGRLVMRSTIPVGKGLGTSAAALVAGFDLGLAVRGRPIDRSAAFRHALALEGHGDNAAPSVYGGLRAVMPGRDPLVCELELSDEIGFAYAAPAHPLSTRRARQALPDQVPHGEAVGARARAVALVRGLATGEPRLLREAVRDEMHVACRLPLIVGGEAAVETGYRAGAWAVTTSGAGSGLIAMCDPDVADRVARAMRLAFAEASGPGAAFCIGFAVRPEPDGLARLATGG